MCCMYEKIEVPANSLLELLKLRYSCRDFSAKPIPHEIICYMLECGRLSASGGNHQPWKFGIIIDPNLIEEITVAASINFCQKWIAKAPLLIVLCTELVESPSSEIWLKRFPSKLKEMQEIDKELFSAISMEEHQTKIPGEHMVLAALEHGIYSTWISSVDCERVGELIGIKDYLVTNVLAFGYPKESKEPTPKKALVDITFTNHFSKGGVSFPAVFAAQ